MTINDLAGSLKAHEQRKKKKKQKSLYEALQVKATIKEEKVMYVQHNHQGRGNFGGCGSGRGRGRGRENNHHERQQPIQAQQNWRGGGRGRGRGDCAYRPNVDCYNCGKHGHYARDCRSPRKVEENMNLITEEETKDNDVLMMAYDDTTSDNDTVWYLDTGASNHMCGHKHLFVEMQEIKDGHVSFGDASKIGVKGRGKIRFFDNGKESVIENVYYVPDMRSNILSLGQLMEKDYSVFMKDRMIQLKDKRGCLIARVEMTKNRMYKLNLRNVREKCLKINMMDKASLWHLWFEHLNQDNIKELAKKDMVHGLPDMDYSRPFCEGCVLGKQARNSFPRRTEYRAKNTLELINTDI